MEDGKRLLSLASDELLKKFGAGDHKPGSGSAAAFSGMLSAQLIRTVISLTCDEKRKKNYSEWVPELQRIDAEIRDRIYPSLGEYFEKDSIQFDKVIRLRQARESETEIIRKRQLEAEALRELVPSTEYPIEIAKLCVELADFAIFTFSRGFKSARGDSGVALTGAISAINGCLSIVDLNLLSFFSNDWTEIIRTQADALRSNCSELSSKEKDCLSSLEDESKQKKAFDAELSEFRSFYLSESRSLNVGIEEVARQLHLLLWKYRRLLNKHGDIDDPFQILIPSRMLKLLGYHYSKRHSLGQHDVQGNLLEVAGIIDRELMEVSISEKFPLETQTYTTAHELGHAILHKQSGLHRDRPIDGSIQFSSRNPQEIQADKFAAFFLMPGKLVTSVFRKIFLMEKMTLNEDIAFSLTTKGLAETRSLFGNLRGFSRAIASAEVYNGKPVISLSKRFRVSTESMAIRIEELGLVEF